MAAISDIILSVLWGLQPYCSLLCVNFPDAPDALVDSITFYAISSNSFAIYLCLASHPLVSFFYRLPKKNATCSLQNIYFSYFCLLIIS